MKNKYLVFLALSGTTLSALNAISDELDSVYMFAGLLMLISIIWGGIRFFKDGTDDDKLVTGILWVACSLIIVIEEGSVNFLITLALMISYIYFLVKWWK
jgi:uncharacterized membrane protein